MENWFELLGTSTVKELKGSWGEPMMARMLVCGSSVQTPLLLGLSPCQKQAVLLIQRLTRI